MTSLTGKTINGYRLADLIQEPEPGCPFDSCIYRADPIAGGDPVTVRLFSQERMPSTQVSQLRDGIQAVARLRHPGVPRILGSGMDGGRPYIVMPYYGAGSLAERFASGLTASLNPSKLLNELADVLDHAHQHAVVHGGLEPSHILLDAETGNVRLLGLGEAPAWAEHRSNGGGSGASISPEVRSGRPATAGSDQYSFAVIALELLTDVPAEQALPSLRAALAGKEPPIGLELNERAALVLGKATNPDPQARFASVGEANRALQIALGYQVAVIESKPDLKPEAPRRKPRRRRLVLIPLLILLIGLIGTIPAYSAGLIPMPEGGVMELISGLAAQPPSEPSPVNEGEPRQAAQLNPESTQDPDAGGDPAADQPTDPPPTSAGADLNPSPTTASAAGSDSPAPTQAPPATPVPTNTAAPTATQPPAATQAPTATAQPPTATSQPPTAAPTNTPKKCNSNPKSANYCTPAP